MWIQSQSTWEQIRDISHTRVTLIMAAAALVLGIVLPVVVTKLTYNKNDMPVLNFLSLERKYEELSSTAKTQNDAVATQTQLLQQRIEADEKTIGQMKANAAKTQNDAVSAQSEVLQRRIEADEKTINQMQADSENRWIEMVSTKLQLLQAKQKDLEKSAPTSPEIKTTGAEIEAYKELLNTTTK